MDSNNQYCRVCGLFLGKDSQGNDYYPWGKDGTCPTFDICECCGVEFGFGDCFPEAVHKNRKKWLEKGNPWRYPEYKPENWSLEEQLKDIPKEFQ